MHRTASLHSSAKKTLQCAAFGQAKQPNSFHVTKGSKAKAVYSVFFTQSISACFSLLVHGWQTHRDDTLNMLHPTQPTYQLCLLKPFHYQLSGVTAIKQGYEFLVEGHNAEIACHYFSSASSIARQSGPVGNRFRDSFSLPTFLFKLLLWSYLWNWNRNGWASWHLPANPLTKRTWFKRQHQRKQTPTWSSGNFGSCWKLELSLSNAWHIP